MGNIFSVIAFFISVVCIASVVLLSEMSKDHTHPTTGIQTDTQVCIDGQGAVDFDLSTARPFLVCGVIREEEEAPPLGEDAHLVQ